METVGEWFRSQNWGSVPDWLAAVGTVGALVLGLVILMRGRAMDERSHADKFVTWLETKIDKSAEQITLVVHGYNSGGAPVPYAFAHAIYRGDQVAAVFYDGFATERSTVGPAMKVRANLVFSTLTRDSPLKHLVLVTFNDERGRQWHRNVRTGEYVSGPRIGRLLYPHMYNRFGLRTLKSRRAN